MGNMQSEGLSYGKTGVACDRCYNNLSMYNKEGDKVICIYYGMVRLYDEKMGDKVLPYNRDKMDEMKQKEISKQQENMLM